MNSKNVCPQSYQKEKTPKKQIVSNEKQVLIISDIDEKDIKEDKSFSDALKENLSDKLDGIPVSKTTLNREGKAILIFPTPESCTQAKVSLRKDYEVENSDRKPTMIQPRIKIHNLDPSLTEYNKVRLQDMIASKNEILKDATDHEFEITFIDSKQNFAIAKVSPDFDLLSIEYSVGSFQSNPMFPLSMFQSHKHLLRMYRKRQTKWFNLSLLQ